MLLTEQIEQIIAARQAYLPVIDSVSSRLDVIEGRVEEVEHVKDQMILPDGSVIENGRYTSFLKEAPDIAWRLQDLNFKGTKKAMAAVRTALKECRNRFARKYINISVVGQARRGKSALLKTISGLDDYVIPAFESTDCTGAPSVIINDPDSTLEARITFKTCQQMTEMAQRYLDRLIPDPGDRIRLDSMQDIRRIKMEDVLAKVPQGHPGRIVGEYLEKMIEHYDEWAGYAGRPGELVLTKKEEIAGFVAQNNGIADPARGRVEYYKYLVVEKCRILCPFPTNAGKINLIDTVGLGDHAEGILEGMLRTVEKESDAVIFMIMPRDGGGGGIPTAIYDIYTQITEACADRDLDKWLFYLINHVKKESRNYAVNTDFCKSALQKLKSSKWYGCDHARIINALDENEVRDEFLLPMLKELSGNIGALDQGYIDAVNGALKDLQAEYRELCMRAQKILQSDFRQSASVIPLVNRLTQEALDSLRKFFFEQLTGWKEKSDQPCPVIYSAADKILNKMKQDYLPGSYIPKPAGIEARLATGEQPVQLYVDYENEIRNAIAKDFLDINFDLKDYVNRMKDDIARVFIDKCGFSAIVGYDPQKPARDWLREFSEGVLSGSYPTLELAVNTICAFEFSVKAFLTYEIRNALNGLDPLYSNTPAIVNKSGNLRRTANSIHMNLLSRLCMIADELSSRLEVLTVKPNLALFAEVQEFFDRIIYSPEAKQEWRNFFAEKSGILWGEEIKKQQNAGLLCQEWIDMVNELAKGNRSDNFVLNNFN